MDVHDGIAEHVRLLLQKQPTAAKERSTEGLLPLHVAARVIGGGTEAVECMQQLLQAHPTAAQERDPDGFLPLHLLAANKTGPSAAIVRLLADAFPQALTTKNTNGLTPLQVAEHLKHLPAGALAELRRLTQGEEAERRQETCKTGKEVVAGEIY
jgi:ankyrin repeat protein